MKESDIRKRQTHDRYLELVTLDSHAMHAERSNFIDVPCPACGGKDLVDEFVKNEFQYSTCTKCSTLFVRNRPTPKALDWFYGESRSSAYWINEFFKPVAEARQQKIFRPRAEYVKARLGDDPEWLIGDVGAGFGLFIREMRKLWPKSRYLAIEPSAEQAGICREAKIEVLQSTLESLTGYDGKFDMLISFELMEHLFNPGKFLETINKMLRPGGYFLATMLNGQGFDIKMLWETSRSVSPPHHLNFLNPDSLSSLMERQGFEVLDLETPGVLDWDIVEGATLGGQADPGRFFRMLAEHGSPEAKAELQQWLSRNRLSSHMRVLARKEKTL